MLETFIFSAGIVVLYMFVWFLISVVAKRNDVVDLAWGPGFLVIAITTMLYSHNYSQKAILISGLVAVWATRLFVHIWPRLRTKTEDFRYATWRKQWGKSVYFRSFFQIFILQGLLMILVAAGIVVNSHNSSLITWYNVLGIVIWTTGFMIETISDRQLASFLAKPTNQSRIMTSGLWHYSRHPNYFGEILQWWGLFLIVLPSTFWYVALLSPLTITFLIVFVSGIPLLEKKFATKPGYAEYANRTSVLVPLPPRK